MFLLLAYELSKLHDIIIKDKFLQNFAMLIYSGLLKEYLRASEVFLKILGPSCIWDVKLSQIFFHQKPYLICLTCCVFFSVSQIWHTIWLKKEVAEQSFYQIATVLTLMAKMICGHCAFIGVFGRNQMHKLINEMLQFERNRCRNHNQWFNSGKFANNLNIYTLM